MFFVLTKSLKLQRNNFLPILLTTPLNAPNEQSAQNISYWGRLARSHTTGRKCSLYISGITSFCCAGQNPRAYCRPANFIPAGHTDAVISQGLQLLDFIQMWRSRGIKNHDWVITQQVSFLDLNEQCRCGPALVRWRGCQTWAHKCLLHVALPLCRRKDCFHSGHTQDFPSALLVLLMSLRQQLTPSGKCLHDRASLWRATDSYCDNCVINILIIITHAVLKWKVVPLLPDPLEFFFQI